MISIHENIVFIQDWNMLIASKLSQTSQSVPWKCEFAQKMEWRKSGKPILFQVNFAQFLGWFELVFQVALFKLILPLSTWLTLNNSFIFHSNRYRGAFFCFMYVLFRGMLWIPGVHYTTRRWVSFTTQKIYIDHCLMRSCFYKWHAVFLPRDHCTVL